MVAVPVHILLGRVELIVGRIVLIAWWQNVTATEGEGISDRTLDVSNQGDIHGPEQGIAAVYVTAHQSGDGRIFVKAQKEVNVRHGISERIYRSHFGGAAPLSDNSGHVSDNLKDAVARSGFQGERSAISALNKIFSIEAERDNVIFDRRHTLSRTQGEPIDIS